MASETNNTRYVTHLEI